MTDHKGLPVAGYRPQSDDKIALVNTNKQLEEAVLRQLDFLAAHDFIDKRWLAIGRTAVENGFMAVNRSVFQPARVSLPDDKSVAVDADVKGEVSVDAKVHRSST